MATKTTRAGDSRQQAVKRIASTSCLTLLALACLNGCDATASAPGTGAHPDTATVQARRLTKLAFTVPPISTIAGEMQDVVIAITDSLGTRDTTATHTVRVAAACALGSACEREWPLGASKALWGFSTVNAVKGLAYFGRLTIWHATSGYTLTASSEGLEGTVSAPFDISLRPGPFAPTGSMITARVGHSATLLPNGKVLIAGGAGSGAAALISAELYDPATRTFSAAGNMASVFGPNAAVLLADGKVLIVGGGRADIYDPATGTFAATSTPPLNSGISRPNAVLLQGGRVLLLAKTGGAEIYDPAKGTFTLAAPYAEPDLVVDTATLLPDGTVLITGFASKCSAGEVYDARADRFRQTGPRTMCDVISNATLLNDGKVLLVEGNSDDLPDLIELYDPSAGTFVAHGLTEQVHEFSAVTRLQDGTVLITGGQMPGGDGYFYVERYLSATGKVVPAGTMVAGRHMHTATLLPDGTVLIVGGYRYWPQPTSTAETYTLPVTASR